MRLFVLSSWNFAELEVDVDDEPETICCWFLFHVSPLVMSVVLSRRVMPMQHICEIKNDFSGITHSIKGSLTSDVHDTVQ